MNRTTMLIGLLVVGGIAGAAWSQRPRDASPPAAATPAPQLSGAQAVIEAAQYRSLQLAIDAVPVGGGAVRLPPGVFEIHEPLVIRQSDLLLVGSGTATHIRNLNEEGLPAILIADPRGVKLSASERIWRVQIANLRVTGNANSGPGILAELVNEIFLQGVTVSYHEGGGIKLDRCYEDPKAVETVGTPSRRILFSGNVLTDVESDHDTPKESVIGPLVKPAGS